MINGYLMISTLKGKSTIKADGIQIETFSWGVSNSTAGAKTSGESRAGMAHLGTLNIAKYVDPTSGELFLHCCNGESFDSGELTLCKNLHGSNKEYIKYKMTKVWVADVSHSPAGENPIENVSLAYGQLEFGYAAEKADKKDVESFVWKGWNVETNKKV
jgi:type VI secretion system Hcp family effector